MAHGVYCKLIATRLKILQCHVLCHFEDAISCQVIDFYMICTCFIVPDDVWTVLASIDE